MNARAEIYIFTNIKVRDKAKRASTVSVLSKIGATETTETGRYLSSDIQVLEGKSAELESLQLKTLKQAAVHRAIYYFESLSTLIQLVYLFS